MMGYPYMSYHWLWISIRLLFWLLVIAGLLLIIRALVGRKEGAEMSAMDILKKRYTRGEITKEEFNEKKKDIAGD